MDVVNPSNLSLGSSYNHIYNVRLVVTFDVSFSVVDVIIRCLEVVGSSCQLREVTSSQKEALCSVVDCVGTSKESWRLLF